jgi:hypothetical protein
MPYAVHFSTISSRFLITEEPYHPFDAGTLVLLHSELRARRPAKLNCCSTLDHCALVVGGVVPKPEALYRARGMVRNSADLSAQVAAAHDKQGQVRRPVRSKGRYKRNTVATTR